MNHPRATAEQLKIIPTFEDLSDEAIKWLSENGQLRYLEPNEQFISPGDEPNQLFAVIEGKLQLFLPDPDHHGEFRPSLIFQIGEIGGYLPFSRMSKVSALGYAKIHSVVYVLHRETFPDMIQKHTEIVQALVSLMTDRVRLSTKQQQAQAKLAALGKLSAGLAHELNNPASAIKRSATELYGLLTQLPKSVKQLAENDAKPEYIEKVIELVKVKKAERQSFSMSMMERNALEDDLADWLEDKGAEDGYCMTESLVEMGVTVDELESVVVGIPDEIVISIIYWLDHSLSTKRLVKEIEDASQRISTLVASIKEYTHMDRGNAMKKANINDGIKSTLSILHHKIRKKNIQVSIDLQENLPDVYAFVGELNQVWTNIIDNAIDALEREGCISIETWEEKGFVQAKFQDNGPGIPKDIQERIFEPFFTTKKQGEGTGMGLDIVRRIIGNHNADIKLKSIPGKTEFTICIPSIHLKTELKKDSVI